MTDQSAFTPFPSKPLLSYAGGRSAGFPTQSANAFLLNDIYVTPVKTIILEVRLDCISPPLLCPPSLLSSVYLKISYLSNIFIWLSAVYMAKPLDSPLPHAHRDWFHFRFLSNVLISHVVFSIDIMNIPQHSLWLLSYPGFVSIQGCRFYSCFIKKILEFSRNLLRTQYSCKVPPPVPCNSNPLYHRCTTTSFPIKRST